MLNNLQVQLTSPSNINTRLSDNNIRVLYTRHNANISMRYPQTKHLRKTKLCQKQFGKTQCIASKNIKIQMKKTIHNVKTKWVTLLTNRNQIRKSTTFEKYLKIAKYHRRKIMADSLLIHQHNIVNAKRNRFILST